jgi:hypothetical protein
LLGMFVHRSKSSSCKLFLQKMWFRVRTRAFFACFKILILA